MSEERSLDKSAEVENLGRCLVKMAEMESIGPIFGRDDEIDSCLRNIERGNNVLFVGDHGVGKTAILEGLGIELHLNHRDFEWNEIVETNITVLQENTEYARQLEVKILLVVKNCIKQKALLAITDIHQGTGAGTSGNDPFGDCITLLNDSLSSYNSTGFRLVATTTPSGYRLLKRANPAFVDKFVRIDLRPLSSEDTLNILLEARKTLETRYHLRISNAAIRKLVEVADRYILHKEFPGKAFDLLRSTAGFCKEKNLEVPHIHQELQRISGLPQEIIDDEIPLDVEKIKDALSAEVFGQEQAIDAVASAVIRFKAGLCDPQRPVGVFTFFGQTGTGKTELAKQLAAYLFGSDNKVFSYPLGIYQGERGFRQLLGSAGSVNCDVFDSGKLLDDVASAPFSVVLLDEIDHASQEVRNALYQILDEGRFVDKKGTEVSFRNAIIILTTNLGATELQRKEPFGFAPSSEGELSDESLRAALKKLEAELTPSFINRTTPVAFAPLSGAVLKNIALKAVKRLVGERLKSRGIELEIGKKLLEILIKEGFDEEHGARSMERAVTARIVNPLSAYLARNPTQRDTVLKIEHDKKGGLRISMKRKSRRDGCSQRGSSGKNN